VQLGAFAVRGNADRLWSRLSGRGELAGKAKLTVPAGGVTKLQAGGFASRDAAEEACRSLQHSGQECLVTR
jgi:cell division septation protein DedD